MSRPMNRRKRTEGGVVLVMFVLMSFAFLSMAALVIDVGHTILARSQMQAAAESAALDGLSNGAADPALTDIGRAEAALTVARHFGEHDGIEYSAGPNIEFEDGIELDGTRFRASQLIDAETIGPYEPTPLQLNLPNLAFGDMVVGQYFDRIDGERTQHVEHSNYTRDDFEPESLLPAPTTDSALLVRMRRTGNLNIDGISSSGPYVPFLFGRGGLMSVEDTGDQAPNPGALADRRFRGTAVRATAIASLEPAVTVGSPNPSDAFAFEALIGRTTEEQLWFIRTEFGQQLHDRILSEIEEAKDEPSVAAPKLVIQGRASFAISKQSLSHVNPDGYWSARLQIRQSDGLLYGDLDGIFANSTVTADELNSDSLGDLTTFGPLPVPIGTEFLARIRSEILVVRKNSSLSLQILQRDVWQEYYQPESENERLSRNEHPPGSRIDIIGPQSFGDDLTPRAVFSWPSIPDYQGWFLNPVYELSYVPVYLDLSNSNDCTRGRWVVGFTPAITRMIFDPRTREFEIRVWGTRGGFTAPSNASCSDAGAALAAWGESLAQCGMDPVDIEVLMSIVMQQRNTPHPLLVPALRRAIR